MEELATVSHGIVDKFGVSKIKTNNEIFVICDTEKYDSEHILQIATKARALADDCGKDVAVLCIGHYNEEQFKTIRQYGVNTVIICEQAKKLNVRDFSGIVSAVIEQRKPEVILFPASDFGKSAAAILSTRFEAGLTADCIDIEITEDTDFCFSRAAINDSVTAKIRCVNCCMKMCTVKKDVFIKKKYSDTLTGEIEKFTFNLRDEKPGAIFEILDIVKSEAKEKVDISKYSIVFCIGRGVKSNETKEKIYKLAEKCGAGVVGTRAVVEEQMIEKERQVGQSGKSISPRIYVGFGVSGASQHMVGIKNAGVIIAINNDKNAAIFDYADYAIVDEVESIVGEMENQLHNVE